MDPEISGRVDTEPAKKKSKLAAPKKAPAPKRFLHQRRLPLPKMLLLPKRLPLPTTRWMSWRRRGCSS